MLHFMAAHFAIDHARVIEFQGLHRVERCLSVRTALELVISLSTRSSLARVNLLSRSQVPNCPMARVGR